MAKVPKKRKLTRCKVCNSGYREEVDRQIVLGINNQKIADYLNERLPSMNFSAQNIYDHRENHLELKTEVMYKVWERRQKQNEEINKKVEDMVFDGITALEQFIVLGAENLLSADTKINNRDWLKALELYLKYSEGEKAVIEHRHYVFVQQYQELVQIVKEEVDDHARERIVGRLKEVKERAQREITASKAIPGGTG